MKNRIFQDMMRKMAKNSSTRKRRAVRLTAAALCAALALGETGLTMYVSAVGSEETQEAGDVETGTEGEGSGTEEGNAAGTGKSGSTGADRKASKEETVYVLAGADGSTKKIIVSDWLKNGAGADTLQDVSELVNIENVGGDEGFAPGTGNEKVWEAKGQDIYYQGNIEKEPPIGLSVTYRLDGKEISPEELAGKSGKVTIRFDYTNRQYEYVEIDGVRTKVYVPFAVVTGMLLDNDVFSNVEISGGRLINDGDRTVVMGFALPGLQENLAMDSDQLDIPDYFEITADVRGFELGMTAAVATNEIFNGIDVADIKAVEELNEAMGELTDAMEQLKDGSSELYDGLCTLLEKSGELISGIDRLSDGAAQMQAGIGTLNDGAARLQDGAGALQAGLSTLSSKNGELNGGARQVFDTLLAMANTQLAAAGLEVPGMTVENYAQVLGGVIASLDSDAVYQQAYSQVSAAVEARRGEIETAVTAAVREQVEGQVKAGAEAEVTGAVLQTIGMTKEEYDAALAGGLIDEQRRAAIESAVSSQMASDAVQEKISQTVEAMMESEEIKGLIGSNVEAKVQQAISENMAGEAVQGQLAAASEGVKSVIALKASLDSYNAFYNGLQAYTAGVAEAAGGSGKLKNGIDELRSGTEKLCSGSSELNDGIQTMKKAAPALTDGIGQLRDGALRLSDGLCEFDEEGIRKLADAVDENVNGLTEKLKAVLEVSKNYRSFTGLQDGMEGQVKFIYRMDSIKAEE